MSGKQSAGILLFRRVNDQTQVLLGHMGGPLWARRDARAWSIPKGEYGPDEALLDAARREFTEELGLPVPAGEVIALDSVRQSGGKVVTAWALEADLDPATVTPGMFTMEWPRGSGTVREFPELDRVAWFDLPTAATKIVAAQQSFLERLDELLTARP